MTKAQKYAWVSGTRLNLDGYTLHVNGETAPQHSCLDGTVFDTFKAAQAIAAAIRQDCEAVAKRIKKDNPLCL